MAKGSKQITVRVGTRLYEEIRVAVKELQDDPVGRGDWTVTEFVIQAIVAKLNHIRRSRKRPANITYEKRDDFHPRVWGE